jgi:uncharacterized protein (TIGR00369 family)
VSKEEHYRKLERMYSAAPCNKYYAPTLRVGNGHTVLIIPVRNDFFHSAGAVHGATYFKALDDAAFFAVSSLVDDVFVLTVSFNIYLTRPISEGKMKSIGRVVHRSQRIFVAVSEVVDSNGQVIARGSGTFMRSTIPLSPEVSYNSVL